MDMEILTDTTGQKSKRRTRILIILCSCFLGFCAIIGTIHIVKAIILKSEETLSSGSGPDVTATTASAGTGSSTGTTGFTDTSVQKEETSTTTPTFSATTSGTEPTTFHTEPTPTPEISQGLPGANIKIPLPAGINIEEITDEDLYLKKRFIIRIPDNYSGILKTEWIKNQAPLVEDIFVTYEYGYINITFCTNEIQGYRYLVEDQTLYVEVRNPADIYDKIVVFDPGHGGKHPGAVHGGHQEKNLNFQILYTVTSGYFADSDIKVYFTRTDDSNPSLKERAAWAKNVQADFFVSLHMNASDEYPEASGVSVYFSKKNNTVNSAGLCSKDLATSFTNALSAAMSIRNRGFMTADYDVISLNTVPAILIELAYMTNPNDLNLITDPKMQETIAETIYQTIVETFETYPTERSNQSMD